MSLSILKFISLQCILASELEKAMFYDIFDSSLGKITVSTDGTFITEVHLQGDRYFKKVSSEWVRDAKQPLLKTAKKELLAYLSGKQKSFDLPLKTEGTSFQKTVWHALQKIPAGKTVTYKELAIKIGNPKAVRAVGTALGHNPICIIIPCHRVIASDGSLGGYASGIKKKQQLLDLESKTRPL